MNNHYELKWNELKYFYDAKTLSPDIEAESTRGLIGQERAAEALKFGLQIKDKGYNLYVSGATGTAIAASLYLSGRASLAAGLLTTSFIAALTVGGKAACKSVALSNNNKIVNVLSIAMCFIARGK